MNIKVKALGLAWNDGRLLVQEVYDRDNRMVGWRPLGGSIKTGESAKIAVVREFAEEIQTKIEVLGEPIVYENIFDTPRGIEHEVLFVFEIDLPATDKVRLDDLRFFEDDGSAHIARWIKVEDIDVDGELHLFPNELKSFLEKVSRCQ